MLLLLYSLLYFLFQERHKRAKLMFRFYTGFKDSRVINKRSTFNLSPFNWKFEIEWIGYNTIVGTTWTRQSD